MVGCSHKAFICTTFGYHLQHYQACININWAASSEFGTYSLCEQRRFRRACASAQSRQNLRCSLIQAVNQEESSDRKPDPWPLWMAGHAQLKCVMTECSKTQIRLTGLNLNQPQTSKNKEEIVQLNLLHFQHITFHIYKENQCEWHSNQPAKHPAEVNKVTKKKYV